MKDKRDEMVRRFIAYARRNKELREQVEQKLSAAMGQFVLARAEMSGEAIEEALAYPARPATVSVDTQHVLSLKMPKLSLETSDTFDYPYGFMNTSAELDSAVSAFAEVLPMLIELAEVEKICNSLADEIEKTRRRVNALEYVMIPQFDEAITGDQDEAGRKRQGQHHPPYEDQRDAGEPGITILFFLFSFQEKRKEKRSKEKRKA